MTPSDIIALGWNRPDRDLNVFHKDDYELRAYATHEKPFDYDWHLYKREVLITKGKLTLNYIKSLRT